MPIPAAPKYEMSIKDALVYAELLDKSKAGRGKPSREMQSQADMLVRDYQYRIKGRSVSKPSSPTAEPAKVERVKAATGKEIAELPEKMRTDDLIPIVNGKPWPMGIKGVCNRCHSSLTYCPCPEPIVNVDHASTGVVTFKVKRG